MSMSSAKKTKKTRKQSPQTTSKPRPKNSEGHKVLAHVLASPTIETNLSNEEKIEEIKFYFSQIMNVLGLDLNDDSLCDTP